MQQPPGEIIESQDSGLSAFNMLGPNSGQRVQVFDCFSLVFLPLCYACPKERLRGGFCCLLQVAITIWLTK
jgi:hypothetical protein